MEKDTEEQAGSEEEEKTSASEAASVKGEDAAEPSAGVHLAAASSSMLQNPFDPRVSGKDPFPKFEDSIAFRRGGDEDADHSDADENNASAFLNTAAAGGTGGAVNLDWSIDTIAEMKPMKFSPLAEQKRAAASEFTPDNKYEQFFDDEAQYNVLRTPSPLIHQQQSQEQQQYLQQRRQPAPFQSRASSAAALFSTPGHPPPRAPTPPSSIHSARKPTPSPLSTTPSSSSTDLHRRCRDAISYCEDRVRERQTKINRLQLPTLSHQHPHSTPPPAKRNKRHTRGHQHHSSEFPWQTPPPPPAFDAKGGGGIHPRSGAATGGIGSLDPWRSSISPFSVPLTPITAPAAMATSVQQTAKHATTTKSAKQPEFSFDGSPISPIAPIAADLTEKTIFEGEEEEEEKESGEVSPIGKAPGGSSPESFASPHFPHSDGEDNDKENRNKRQQLQPSLASSSSSGSSSSVTLSSSWGKISVEDSSISLKSLSMLHDSTVSAASTPPPPPPPSSSSRTSSSSISDSLSGSGSGHSAAPKRESRHKSDTVPASPSIAQRQESFMAAIEAEANPHHPKSAPPLSFQPPPQLTRQVQVPHLRTSAIPFDRLGASATTPATTNAALSIPELYKEAKALGITEPLAQWEYVQILTQQRNPRTAASSSQPPSSRPFR